MKQTLGAWKPAAEDRPVSPREVIDLMPLLKPDGTLEWDVLEGEWPVLQTG